MKRKIILPVVIVVAVVAALAVFWWVRYDHAEPVTQLVAYGNVDIRQVELAFNAAERIDDMQVREGERVHKGQPLATLDTRSLSQNVDQRAAQAAAQEQVLARLMAGSRPQEIRKARAEVEAARVAADNAERTYARIKALVARQFVAEQQASDARAAADGAQAQLKAARETLQLAMLGARKEDIAAARATLEAARAALAIARKQLADAVLYAPADGVIEARILEPGDMASPQHPVYTLALTDPVWVRAYVPGPQLGKIHPGMRAVVTTDSYPDKRYQAWVGYISPTAEFTPKAVETTEVRTSLVYQMRIFVCDPRNELRQGMPATIAIPFDQPADSGAAAQPCPQS
ncbi:MAG: efflux RND transporter periplasmic adaptor subunit [Thiobacillus sp.]